MTRIRTIEARDGQVMVFNFPNPSIGPELAVYVYGTYMGDKVAAGVGLTLDQARALRRTITKVIREIEAEGDDV